MRSSAPEVYEEDGAKMHRPRYTTYEAWSNLGFAAWFLTWAMFNLGSGNWAGWVMLPLAGAFGALGVWSIVWRWKGDVELARLDGQLKALDELHPGTRES